MRLKVRQYAAWQVELKKFQFIYICNIIRQLKSSLDRSLAFLYLFQPFYYLFQFVSH